MKAVGFIAWAFLTISAQAAHADVSCDVLGQGNKLYSSGNLEEALNIYKTVEEVDRYGKQQCTMSVYATIATIYTMMGDKQLEGNATKAAFLYKTASKYNRAFAYAVDCHRNNCEYSKKFWDAGGN
jgi:hypothetical protein